MAANLIKLDEAAQMLGVSPDEVVEWRSAGEIHGYRDGASWKFKLDEIKRVAEEKGIKLAGEGSDIGMTLDSSSMDLAGGSSSLMDGYRWRPPRAEPLHLNCRDQEGDRSSN